MSLLGVGVSKLAGLDTTIRQVAHPFSHPNLDKSDVVQCTDPSCLSFTFLLPTPVSLGTVHTGVPVRLFVRWDQAGHQFIFQRDNNVMVLVPYSVPDTSEPGVQFKRLDAAHFVANCTSTPRPASMIDVRFDHVEVNQ